MNPRWAWAFLVLVLMAPLSLTAHDPSKHKGKPTQGEVLSVTKDHIELKTAAGTKTVTLVEKTKIERGNQTATPADLRKGDHVMVFGTTLASGELVAREILIGKPATHKGHKTQAGGKH